MWTGQGYPEGNILKQGQELMPDRAALISVLGSGKEIILISPSTPHAVLTAALSGPSSLLVVHHLRTACRDAVATLEVTLQPLPTATLLRAALLPPDPLSDRDNHDSLGRRQASRPRG